MKFYIGMANMKSLAEMKQKYHKAISLRSWNSNLVQLCFLGNILIQQYI